MGEGQKGVPARRLRAGMGGGLDLGLEKTNANGSGVAIGHPRGRTGMRIPLSLVNALAGLGDRRGLATLCIGGGEGMHGGGEAAPLACFHPESELQALGRLARCLTRAWVFNR